MRGDLGSRPGQNELEQRSEHRSQRLLPDPSERETCQRDSELGCRDVSVEMIDDPKKGSRAPVSFGYQRSDARAPNAYERELRRDEESVSQHQEENNGQLEQDS